MVIFRNNTVNLDVLLVLEKGLEMFSTISLTFKKETTLIRDDFHDTLKIEKTSKQWLMIILFFSCHQS